MCETPNIKDAQAALQKYFGYPAFRRGQEEVIGSALRGSDVLAVLPTGGGKSICYQIPALLLPRLTVVISPLISLMQDQVAALERRGIGATYINSTLSHDEITQRLARARAGAARLLYLAPERFESGGLATRLRAAGVGLLAVDEAHCISEWGHDFRPSYKRLAHIREMLGHPPAMALTATATPRVQRDIIATLGLKQPEIVVTGFDRANLDYHVSSVKSQDEKDAVLLNLAREASGTIIVYASTRRSVERVTVLLRRAGVRADAYHAGLHARRRDAVQSSFMSGKCRALVATNAFGMGIDKPDVRLVVHHSMPGTLEAYYQEAGRAGRDGLASSCMLLHAFADRFTHEFFIRTRMPEIETIKLVVRSLLNMCDTRGFVENNQAASAAMRRAGVQASQVQSCLALLTASGAIERVLPPHNRFTVRLIGTVRRIRDTLSRDGRELEMELLRSLWRLAGAELERGATFEVQSLPAGLRDERLVHGLLGRLEGEQLLVTNTGGAGWLVLPRLEAADFFRDAPWRALEYRRRVEFAKLQTMQSYALVRSCRRAFLLRYFGDATPRRNCGACDNCTRPSSPRSQLSTEPVTTRSTTLQTMLRLRRASRVAK